MASVLLRNRQKEAATAIEVTPHQWALSLWARGFRRLARPWVVARHVRQFCQPLTIEGSDHFSELRTPAVVIANHTSHFDTIIVLSLLPNWLYSQTAVAAAADRFFRETIKGAWFSLRYNAFPIARGGGSGALAYAEWLLQNGRSVLIFPEGTRSRTGELLPFHPGPAILALRQGVPILPISIQGAANILRPGTRWSRPAAVHVRVGTPLSLDGYDDVTAATAHMEEAMRALVPQSSVEIAASAEPVGVRS